jgi:hypothetical protein
MSPVVFRQIPSRIESLELPVSRHRQWCKLCESRHQLVPASSHDSSQDVALTGWACVQAGISFRAIQPGALFITSDTPGYAMKVTDHVRAQGAILGKAVGSLTDGKGTLLVPATLQ